MLFVNIEISTVLTRLYSYKVSYIQYTEYSAYYVVMTKFLPSYNNKQPHITGAPTFYWWGGAATPPSPAGYGPEYSYNLSLFILQSFWIKFAAT